MPVRPFQRHDRDQLTRLVNRHADAVLPGIAVPVNAVLSQLEREPREVIVDPWVVERRTLLGVAREAVLAAAHLLRYSGGGAVSASYRDAAEIRWLVFDPREPALADELMAACLTTMQEWGAARRYADGSLPALATYGVPDCWPHVRALYERSGFVSEGRVETILTARIDQLPGPSPAPAPGLGIRRSVGDCGTRFSAVREEDEEVGMIEVEIDPTGSGSRFQPGAWSDIGNLHVRPADRERGIGTWLLATAGAWLALGGVARIVAYAESEEPSFLERRGFARVTRTERGWAHRG